MCFLNLPHSLTADANDVRNTDVRHFWMTGNKIERPRSRPMDEVILMWVSYGNTSVGTPASLALVIMSRVPLLVARL